MAAAKDPWLLTPGPLTTSAATKEAMLHDWGSRDAQFIETNARVLRRLLDIAGAVKTHVCVPLQGSGTFSDADTDSNSLSICFSAVIAVRWLTV